MEKLVSVAEMQSIEREANEKGLSYRDMMENAGTNLAFFVHETFGEHSPRTAFALIGSGNNGGDALVALSKLNKLGWKTSAYIVKTRPEGDDQLQRYLQTGGKVFFIEQDTDQSILGSLLAHPSVLIDGILGTGVRFPLSSETEQVMGFVKQLIAGSEDVPCVIAVDCPSGVDCDTGAVASNVIPADVTFTMAAIKRGLFAFPAAELVGKIQVGGIGEIKGLETWQSVKRGVLTDREISQVLPVRSKNAHKGTFGTALVIAGAANYPGAVLLAGTAAYRIGAGLVKIAIPEYIYPAVVGHLKEATWVRLPHTSGWINEDADQVVFPALSGVNALLVGPGLGLEKTTYEFMRKLVDFNLPATVIDADGLKLLASIPDWDLLLGERVVLTPHPGEMAILTGISIEEIQTNRLEVAETYAHQWGKVVVLKGAYTVIANPEGSSVLIPFATPALARAGTGDVLAGLIVGLLAQGIPLFEAAYAGAYIHARAGLMIKDKYGNSSSVLAGDLLDVIPKVLSKYQNC